MRRRDGDDDGDAADVDPAGAVGDGDLAELVARLQLLGQLGHDLLGHARVALVLEVVHGPAARIGPRGADEGGDPAGGVVRDLLDDQAGLDRLVREHEGATRDRRDERDLVAVRDGRVLVRVLEVDRIEQAHRLVPQAERGPHVGHAVDAVELALRPTGALAKPGEEAHADHDGEPSLTQ